MRRATGLSLRCAENGKMACPTVEAGTLADTMIGCRTRDSDLSLSCAFFCERANPQYGPHLHHWLLATAQVSEVRVEKERLSMWQAQLPIQTNRTRWHNLRLLSPALPSPHQHYMNCRLPAPLFPSSHSTSLPSALDLTVLSSPVFITCSVITCHSLLSSLLPRPPSSTRTELAPQHSHSLLPLLGSSSFSTLPTAPSPVPQCGSPYRLQLRCL